VTDQAFKRFTVFVNGLCIFVSLNISMMRWDSNSEWALPVTVVVFGVGAAIQVAVGRRRPGHAHDNFRDALR
jgi:hypothetical protein